MSIYYWDFFGPYAEGTAKHYHAHVIDFLKKHALRGCETGTETAGSGHFAVFCRAPLEHSDTIVRALKPQRTR